MCEGQAAGELRPDLAPALAATLLAAANVSFFEPRAVFTHLPGTRFVSDPEDSSAQVMDLLLTGMAAPGLQ